MASLILPGVVDAHVHLRDPGATHKEDIATGTAAALAGGVIGVLDMPNNSPPIVDRATLLEKQALYASKAVSDYGLFLGCDGTEVTRTVELAEEVVGLKLYLDETFGDLTLSAPRALASIFEAWPGPGPIAIHGKSESIAMALDLASRFRQELHVCHVPHPNDLLRIDVARERGVAVTCEVTPHHLFLTSDDERSLGALGRMKPPLVPPEEVNLFWERLELVDMVASDHAPHTRTEKTSPEPPPGVPGLETTLPLMLWAVDQKRLTLERMIELLFHNPLATYGLEPPDGTRIEVRLGDPYRLPREGYHTRCGWSPFTGKVALGHVERVWLRDHLAWEHGETKVAPGYGQPMRRVAS